MKLPTWEQAAEAVQNDTATQLEAFIYEYQPKGYPDAWRCMLSEAIKEAYQQGASEAIDLYELPWSYLEPEEKPFCTVSTTASEYFPH